MYVEVERGHDSGIGNSHIEMLNFESKRLTVCRFTAHVLKEAGGANDFGTAPLSLRASDPLPIRRRHLSTWWLSILKSRICGLGLKLEATSHS